MTPEETAELRQLAIELKRGMKQLERAYQMLANYIDICYTNKEYIEPDETATIADATE